MRVKALVDVFVEGTYRKAGEIFGYSGPKNENLVSLKKEEADAAEAAAEAEEKQEGGK